MPTHSKSVSEGKLDGDGMVVGDSGQEAASRDHPTAAMCLPNDLDPRGTPGAKVLRTVGGDRLCRETDME